eukprot:TRINITY_DN6320_c3_g1_i1.p1 TRINITY_DN6320_c3_g1~~TRINITY_DN6320_c3_g1_i1.p1  ORF type:complete len:466 (+),score=44.90 TRINITY_DN6320_c3_g1_i1:58-1398(+)
MACSIGRRLFRLAVLAATLLCPDVSSVSVQPSEVEAGSYHSVPNHRLALSRLLIRRETGLEERDEHSARANDAERGKETVARRDTAHATTRICGRASNDFADRNAPAQKKEPILPGLPSDGTDKDISFYLLDADHWATSPTLEGFGDLIYELKQHRKLVSTPDKARFVLTAYHKCFQTAFKKLPRRSKERPYLLWGYDRCDSPQEEDTVKNTRDDILLVGYDLRPFYNDTDTKVPGITFPPPRGILEPIPHGNLTTATRFFLTFRGEKSIGLNYVSKVRVYLKDAFADFSTRRPDVLVQIHEPCTGQLQHYKLSYGELFNSSYVLVPRGQGRWTYRFSEAVRACSIPVVISDGLTLPFEELIDWSQASIRLPENISHKDGANAIVSALPKDPVRIKQMRTEVCRLYAKYFQTFAKRADALLLAAAVHVDKMRAVEEKFSMAPSSHP